LESIIWNTRFKEGGLAITYLVYELHGKCTLYVRPGCKCRMQGLVLAADIIVIALQSATNNKIKQELMTCIL